MSPQLHLPIDINLTGFHLVKGQADHQGPGPLVMRLLYKKNFLQISEVHMFALFYVRFGFFFRQIQRMTIQSGVNNWKKCHFFFNLVDYQIKQPENIGH